MSTQPSAALETAGTAQNRAQGDAPGFIDVTNESHENPAFQMYFII